MLDAVAAEALTRTLMLGTARQALPVAQAFQGMVAPDDAKAALKALALLGQRNRFVRPSPTPPAAAGPLFADARALVPAPARPLLISLFSGKGGNPTDCLALAVSDAMARKQLKLHPFDLPRLDEFVKAHGERLGASAVAWAERHASEKSADPQAYSFAETVDATNWMHGRPAQKVAFIRALRATAPDTARELVAGAFAREQAAVRVTVLKALAEGLSEADAPFLESLAKDRAPSVREAAETLLARLPGSPRAAKRLQDCLSRIKIGKGGLLRRRTVLQIEYPATVKDGQRETWAVATFGAIGLDDFAAGLGLSVDDVAAAAANDPVLTLALAVQASQARRFDLLARLVRDGATSAWASIIQADDPDLSDPASATAWSAAAIQADLWPDMPAALSLARLYERIRLPLPERTTARLFASKAWRSFLDFAGQQAPPGAGDAIVAVAALTAAPLRRELRADLAPLAPALTARAFAAMSLLDHIEAT